jgi:hypothetical protein
MQKLHTTTPIIHAISEVLKMCAVKFRQQRGTKIYVFKRILLIARRWLPFSGRSGNPDNSDTSEPL